MTTASRDANTQDDDDALELKKADEAVTQLQTRRRQLAVAFTDAESALEKKSRERRALPVVNKRHTRNMVRKLVRDEDKATSEFLEAELTARLLKHLKWHEYFSEEDDGADTSLTYCWDDVVYVASVAGEQPWAMTHPPMSDLSFLEPHSKAWDEAKTSDAKLAAVDKLLADDKLAWLTPVFLFAVTATSPHPDAATERDAKSTWSDSE